MIVVVALVAVLLSAMLPAYRGQVIGVHRSLAWAELLKVTARQEQFLLNHGWYAETLTDLGLPHSPYAIDAQGTAREALAGGRIYLVSLVTRRDGYTIMATPQQGQAEDQLCGTLSIDSAGRRRSAGAGSLHECW
jgi:Tfp pilus assembly protein PilE